MKHNPADSTNLSKRALKLPVSLFIRTMNYYYISKENKYHLKLHIKIRDCEDINISFWEVHFGYNEISKMPSQTQVISQLKG